MPIDPLDPFKEERKQIRLLHNAMGGSTQRILEEERKYRKLVDDAVGGRELRFLQEEQKLSKLFEHPEISNAAQDIIDHQQEPERLFRSYYSDAIEQYFVAEDARRRTFDIGTIASAKAFQDNIASTMAAIVGPYAKLSEQIKELGVFDRIALQQSALIKASSGLNTQFEAARRAMQEAFPTASQISTSFGVQSALAENLRRISDQFSNFDEIAGFGGITESSVWEMLRETYSLNDQMTVSQVFLEIGTSLDQTTDEGNSFGFYEAWQLIQFLWFVFSVYAVIVGLGDYTEGDRARDDATAEAVERIENRQQMKEIEVAIAEASALSEMARINKLPRAFVLETANVRAAPEQKAERTARLDANTIMAIEEKRGRWFRVIYSDPLTEELTEGWIWGGSVEQMSKS